MVGGPDMRLIVSQPESLSKLSYFAHPTRIELVTPVVYGNGTLPLS